MIAWTLMMPPGGAVAEDLLAVAWPAMAEEDLDDQRGGFTTDGGLSISFGIEQVVLLDGVLQVTKSYSFDAIGGASGATAGNAADIVQTGPGNSIRLADLPLGVATFVQNSLDLVKIENATVINVTVTNLDFVRLAQIGVSLTQQLVGALK